MKTALIFPPLVKLKQGSFLDLYESFPSVRAKFEEASEIMGVDLAAKFFFESEAMTNFGVIARPSIVTISTALFELLREEIGQPAYFLGPSLGQVTAIHCAGGLPFPETLRMLKRMCEMEEEEFPDKRYGVYFFYNIDIAILEQSIQELTAMGRFVEPCVTVNATQMIVNGDQESLELLHQKISPYGGLGVTIPYGPPGHCSLLQNVRMRMEKEVLPHITFRSPDVPLISNVNAEEISDAAGLATELTEQYTNSVCWYKCLQQLWSKGVEKVIMLGPGNFIHKSLGFTDIPFAVQKLLDSHDVEAALTAKQK
ncbi:MULTISPECIES: ACP S-malonyltransferase [Brevibacillus]|jgi:[acyl-carrier-protein] S-malonyltransferase|uniref:ACP S-malonyltransferase n=1 Tax=Brevibacillus TaxID=55080 RepID=UPI0004F33E72|nr:ACP S-malonyltransferase [Brevibacillus borstelensis]KKX56144.1 malonyl CoA-acyl carrier protein transacylase [Brevibacillus borstelensis cifa_chp40]MCM3621186.1 ACP S-malonyltransferase [Brevibacillus borstelensis]MED1745576.1 ACP S-malonyltransferase [Brevibacillus borstelensis]MED1853599.1 ACP S-malonyltransferase [Brevibacillus borstelensis]MED1873396.1 ACP S-malonyltransferase [Brevibacillus borstelensis]